MKHLRALGVCGFFCAFLIIFSRAQNSSRPTYLVSVPSLVHHGTPISLAVTVFTLSPVKVTAELLLKGTVVMGHTEKTIKGGSTGLYVLPPIPNTNESYGDTYTLVVNGYMGKDILFSNSTTLEVKAKRVVTFIQTDKSYYKPGQPVKIRVVSLGPDGKPHKSKANLVLKDPRGNTIQQWLSLDSFLGVVSTEFQLSENPPLGNWTIEAVVSGVNTEKAFTVDYYVLPVFHVVLQTPAIIHYEDILIGSVTAQYTYRKPVRGTLVVSAQISDSDFDEFRTVNKTMEMNGAASFNFSFSDFFQRSLTLSFGKVAVTVTAIVTEALTGLKNNDSTVVDVVRHRYSLLFCEYPRMLKPSLNFSALLKVSLYNRMPLNTTDLTKNVTVTVIQYSSWYSYWMRQKPTLLEPGSFNDSFLHEESEDKYVFLHPEETRQNFSFPVPANGLIHVHFQLRADVVSLSLEAQFHDSIETTNVYRTYSSPSGSYLQLYRTSYPLQGNTGKWTINQESPAQVGVPLPLIVQSNFPLAEFHYLVTSRGQIVTAGTKSSASFSLNPTESWAPLASIIAYILRPGGEVVGDVLRVPVPLALKNSVSLSWSPSSVKPAEKVQLKVSVSEPGSLVGILVVDKATKWPRGITDNNISEKKILEMLTKSNNYACDETDNNLNKHFMGCELMLLTDVLTFGDQNFISPFLWFLPPMLLQESSGPHVRRDFPETWLWLDAKLSESETASFPVTVPDSITTWIASAIVVSDNLGFGLTDVPAELPVFQNFFLSLNLPAYIIREEKLILEVILHNYLEKKLEVLVTVSGSQQFQFVFEEKKQVSAASMRKVSVGSQESTSVLFVIRPTVLGEITISVKALSFFASDAIIRKVLVKPEGIEQVFAKSLFLELEPSETSLSDEILFAFPEDVVKGSEKVQVTVAGDILGPSIKGLDSLVQMPYGCGEQNMINFAPNIYVLQYLNKTNQVKVDIQTKAVSFMVKGYQQELTYQRQDGSFSAFGDSDSSGSTWLTAFVLRCFLQSRPFILIDDSVLSKMTAWLVGQQVPDGSFQEPGRVIHTELQGKVDGPISLTAYVLIALLEDPAYMGMYTSQISSAQMFLESKAEHGISSNYSLCLVAYALSLAHSSMAETTLMELLRRADVKDGVMSWRSGAGPTYSDWQPRSVDVEIVSYMLLNLFRQAKVVEGLSLLKWLCKQRNPQGGFGSTQDTIMALQALSYYALLGGADAINLKIRVSTNTSRTVTRFQIDSTNYLLHQSQEIDTARSMRVSVSVEGRGFAVFQINFFYNIKSEKLSRRHRGITENDAFDLDVEFVGNITDMDHLTLSVCTRLLGNQSINQTGMALMELGLLSGFSLSDEGVHTDDLVKKVDTSPGKVILYLDSVTTSEVCIEIPTKRIFKVAHVQDATVTIYDYYEPQRKVTRSYNSAVMRDMPTCSFCGQQCKQCQSAGATVLSVQLPVPILQPAVIGCPAFLALTFVLHLLIQSSVYH